MFFFLFNIPCKTLRGHIRRAQPVMLETCRDRPAAIMVFTSHCFATSQPCIIIIVITRASAEIPIFFGRRQNLRRVNRSTKSLHSSTLPRRRGGGGRYDNDIILCECAHETVADDIFDFAAQRVLTLDVCLFIIIAISLGATVRETRSKSVYKCR